MTQVVYRIDAEDRLVALGSDWQRFASANEGAAVGGNSVIGRRLFDFISGPTVREIYAAVIQHARWHGRVQFRFRCDAPEWRREFEMVVAGTGTGDVEFRSTLLRESARPAIALLRPHPTGGQRLIRMCSWCHAIADDAGRWVPLEQAIASLPVMEPGDAAPITHGICPTCADAMRKSLEN